MSPADRRSASADIRSRRSLKAAAFAAARGLPTIRRVIRSTHSRPLGPMPIAKSTPGWGLTAISRAWSFEKGRRTTPPFSYPQFRDPLARIPERDSSKARRIRGGARSYCHVAAVLPDRDSLKASPSRPRRIDGHAVPIGSTVDQFVRSRRLYSARRADLRVSRRGRCGPPCRRRRSRTDPSRGRRACPRRGPRPARRHPRAARPSGAASSA
jgi:hypothetical protein